MKIVWILIISFFLLSCSGHKNQLFYKNAQPIQQADFQLRSSDPYRLQPHDRVSIVFYKYPELSTIRENIQDSTGIEVSSKGTIELPLVKTLYVKGLTKEQLQNLLYQKYSPYLKDPSVKVEILNKRVYVVGEVKNPGSLDLLKYQKLTPLKAIIQKGGLTSYANAHSIKVLRQDPTSYKLINIDLTDIKSVKANNIALRADDIVYVPHNRAKDFSLPLNGVSPTLNIINTILNSAVMYKTLND